MVSKNVKRALIRKRSQGTFDENKQTPAQSPQQQHAQELAAKLAILRDTNIFVPGDLTPEYMTHNETELDKDDYASANQELYHAKPDMKLTMLRIIFLRNLDPYHNFNIQIWQTRASLLAARIGQHTSPSDDAYVQAVEEASNHPSTFVARERYITMWKAGQARLTHWPRSVHKRQSELGSWARLQWYAIQTLAYMDEQDAEAGNVKAVAQLEEAIGDLTDEFAGLAKLVKREFDMGGLTRKLEVLSLLGQGTGVEGAFGA